MNAIAYNPAPRRMPFSKVVSVSLISVLAAFAGLYFGRHAVTTELINRVEAGMTKDEVIRLLGEPQFASQEKYGTVRLSYRKHDRWCMLDVLLGPESQVLSVFHDH